MGIGGKTVVSDTGVPFDEIEYERRQRRRETVVALGRFEDRLLREVERYRGTCRHFFELLDRTPKEAIYASGRAVNRLLDIRDSFKAYQGDLVAGNVRLHLGGRFRTPLEAAKWLIEKYDPIFLKQRPDAGRKTILARAFALLDGEVWKLDEKLAALRQVRGAIVSAIQAVLERVHDAARLGLVDRSAPEVIELELLVDYCFPGSIALGSRPKSVRQAAAQSVQSRLSNFGMQPSFHIVTSLVCEKMEATLPLALERKAHGMLRAAARQLAADLDSWCGEPALPDQLATAILALHFSFTSAREGLGGLSAAHQNRYERDLAAASPAEVRRVIASLIDMNLLVADDCELFRYTPSIGRPFQEYCLTSELTAAALGENKWAATSQFQK